MKKFSSIVLMNIIMCDVYWREAFINLEYDSGETIIGGQRLLE